VPTTNIIVNGSFDAGSTGWSGTDLETSYNEGAYLGNGSANRVAEIDGFANQITVMEQSFTVSSGFATNLTFRTALRTASLGNAGTEGFVVSIRDGAGNVISSQTVLPTTSSWDSITLPVTFPTAGTYTVSFSEIGPNDSLGAIVDDVALLVCFAAGTMIDTDLGPRRVERLARGDRVWTVDGGFQPIRWIAARRVTLAEQLADVSLRPVRFRAGALGPGRPLHDLYLSQQHRICVSGWQAELHYGLPEVLVPALAMVDGNAVQIMRPETDVTYVHFLLNGHQLVRANGVESESFFPTALSLRGIARQARAELARIFPDMATLTALFPHTVRPAMRVSEARLVA
jgi:Hint domain